ncbi:molybdenum cofactor guanylyltransferase [Rhodocaloribacter litoris]|uniref:molybdenum cofactor guanylyltransferase n=1 Tax=Rhodocaloribacter litoris TaxID=2558931 RepID=UPI001420C432|nr:molybdenum cofactor guanylyltransferase [Rhodocaloribacter litoris]QXD16271.1 molybdenum cofactor guanylyltransferase [Rhodocaloribacter litoris]
MEKESVTGLILAGGTGRRFGSDKARAVVAGRPMIERVYRVVAPVAGTVLLSVRPGQEDYGLPVRRVEDPVEGAGPLAGLLAGLEAAETPWLLAVACDLPFLSEDILRTLLAACRPGLDAVVPRTPDGRLHPLCAAYATTVRPVVAEQLAAGRRALHALLDRLGAVRLVDVPAAPLRNINRPDDLPTDLR